MRRFIPPRWVLVALPISVFGLVVFYLYFSIFSSDKPGRQVAYTAETAADNEVYRDSDGDGLRDWEEVLWKTDPNKADSDGDSTSDGDEVAQNRNPSQAAPNDTLENKFPFAQTAQNDGQNVSSGVTAESSLTDQIGGYIISQYLAQKQNGEAPNAANMRQALESISGKIQELSYEREVIHQKDSLIITSDPNAGDAFLKNTDVIIARLFQMYPDHKVEVALGANPLEAFGLYAEAYATTEKALLAQPVPSRYMDPYLDLINIVGSTKKAAANLSTLDDQADPILMLVSISKFQQAEANIAYAMRKITK